jgi:hypothetical protein
MKNFVSGWRRPASKAGRPKTDPDTPITYDEREYKRWMGGGEPATPQQVEKRRKPAPPPVPDAEVIDTPRRPARPLTLPSVRVPGNLGQWGMLAVWAALFKLSADATHAAAVGTMFPEQGYMGALIVQGALSLIERFHFAGNRSGFTWGALFVDTGLTATGLGLALLPSFFQTPLYQFFTDMAGGFGAGGFTGFSLGVLALALGFVVAYSGDKALDLAMGR